jgi:transcriptional regulator with XRE-family HTH domain
METLGKRLRSTRKNNNFNQAELAKKSGVSQQLISQIENEKIKSTNDIFSLSDALNVNAKWLATGVGDMNTGATNKGDTKEEMQFLNLLRSVTADQRKEMMQSLKSTHLSNERIIKELSGSYSA